MRWLQNAKILLAAGLLLGVLSPNGFAQKQKDQGERDRMAAETTLTGCLSKDASGMYMLTDDSTGTKTTLAESSKLEKHTNHKVKVTGTLRTDTAGNSILEVSKVQQVSGSCGSAPRSQ